MLRLFACFVLFCSLASRACEAPQACVEQGGWQLGIALGAGMRTNPLVDGDNIPLILLPDIAWYGQAAYFDNGELGYQWHGDGRYALDTFLTLDRERAFFSFWHPANVLSPLAGLDASFSDTPEPAQEAGTPQVSIDDVARRDWAVHAGVRLHVRDQTSEWTLSWQKDISAVHNGHKLILRYHYAWQWQTWRFSLTPHLLWKSTKLVDYYYGLDARDQVPASVFFDAGAGWQAGIGFSASKQLNESWQWFTRLAYQDLHGGMHQSPLVEDSSIQTFFTGLGYRF